MIALVEIGANHRPHFNRRNLGSISHSAETRDEMPYYQDPYSRR